MTDALRSPVVSLADLTLDAWERGTLYKSADASFGKLLGLANLGISYSEVPPGKWVVRVAIEPGSLEQREIPVELAIQVLDPNEAPGTAVQPGKIGGMPAPSATPRVTATPSPAPSSSSSSAAVPVTGLIALLAGLAGGFTAMRRRLS